jgi:protein-disulfide isomerase
VSSKQAKRRRSGQPQSRGRSRPDAARREASPRVLIAAVAIVVLLIAGVVAAVKLTGGSSGSSPSSTASVALPGAGDVQRLLKGVPQTGNVLGEPSAPVTMVEYVDLQCPYCQQFETQVMPNVIERFVRTGKLKVELRILAFIGPDSQRGQAAAIAAAKQGREFNFVQLLYGTQAGENSGWLSDEMVTSAANSIPGLDTQQLLSDAGASGIKTTAQQYVTQATADKVSGTPTLLVGHTGSTLSKVSLQSPTDEQSLADAINAAAGG